MHKIYYIILGKIADKIYVINKQVDFCLFNVRIELYNK